MKRFQKGQEVYHPVHGKGKILYVRHHNERDHNGKRTSRRVLIEFEKRRGKWDPSFHEVIELSHDPIPTLPFKERKFRKHKYRAEIAREQRKAARKRQRKQSA